MVVLDWAKATSAPVASKASATRDAPVTRRTAAASQASQVENRGVVMRRISALSIHTFRLFHSRQGDPVDEAALCREEGEDQRQGDQHDAGHERTIVRAGLVIGKMQSTERRR